MNKPLLLIILATLPMVQAMDISLSKKREYKVSETLSIQRKKQQPESRELRDFILPTSFEGPEHKSDSPFSASSKKRDLEADEPLTHLSKKLLKVPSEKLSRLLNFLRNREPKKRVTLCAGHSLRKNSHRKRITSAP